MDARGRKLCIGLSFLLLFAAVIGTASSNSNGAPANAARDGCSCHGGASTEATVVLVVPATYEPGQTYDVRVSVTGPMPLPAPVGQNAGGFALEVSAGTLTATGGVQAENQYATHMTAGNDRRSWDLKWTAPAASADVTFHASANAVNGDGQSIQDRWNKATAVVKPAPVANATVSASPSPSPSPSATIAEGSSSVSLAFAAVVVVALAVVRRRV